MLPNTATTPIYYLTYISTIKVAYLLKPHIFNDIHNKALEFNRKHNISGFLCYGSRCFFQYLEGDKHIVQSLFAKIKQDSRHHNIKLIGKGDIDARRCQSWCMNVITPKALAKHHKDAKSHYYPFTPYQWCDAKINNFTEFCISQYHIFQDDVFQDNVFQDDGKANKPNQHHADLGQTVKVAIATHQVFILLQAMLVLLAIVAFGLIHMF